MAGVDTNLAATALAIALVALLVALGQLFQQYLGTADGYRRCQKSVMGGYAKRTRLHWRWSEFRFETLYSTPEIFLAGDGASNDLSQVLITGDTASRGLSLLSDESLKNPQSGAKIMRQREWYSQVFRDEMSCWIPLLYWINHTVQMSRQGYEPAFPIRDLRLPAILIQERSWDFQPPDVVRPLAKTTLSDIAIIARRMGMKWKEFRPSDGILRAEGHSHIITSTIVRSLGLVLQYSYTGYGSQVERDNKFKARSASQLQEQEEIYIPRASADRLGCGVVRPESKYDIPDFPVSTQRQIASSLLKLDRSGKSTTALNLILKDNPEFRFPVADIVAFVTKDIRHHPGSSLVQIPAPSDNVNGFSASVAGRRAFRESLEAHIASHSGPVGEQTKECLKICHELSKESPSWDDISDETLERERWVVKRDSAYLDTVQRYIWSLTNFLDEKLSQLPHRRWYHAHRYRDLLEAHLKFAIFCEGGETSTLRNLLPDYKADVEGYFANLPTIFNELRVKWIVSEEEVVDVWVSMMLRAMCWGTCHFFVPGERVPLQYFGSQLPVYIG
jgi:hypothetical protein